MSKTIFDNKSQLKMWKRSEIVLGILIFVSIVPALSTHKLKEMFAITEETRQIETIAEREGFTNFNEYIDRISEPYWTGTGDPVKITLLPEPKTRKISLDLEILNNESMPAATSSEPENLQTAISDWKEKSKNSNLNIILAGSTLELSQINQLRTDLTSNNYELIDISEPDGNLISGKDWETEIKNILQQPQEIPTQMLIVFNVPNSDFERYNLRNEWKLLDAGSQEWYFEYRLRVTQLTGLANENTQMIWQLPDRINNSQTTTNAIVQYESDQNDFVTVVN